MPKFIILFFENADDNEHSRSEEIEATTLENALEAANAGLRTTEARIEAFALPDGLSADRAVGVASL